MSEVKEYYKTDDDYYWRNGIRYYPMDLCLREQIEKLQSQLEKAEKVIEEIKDFDNNDHLDVVGCELQGIAREYFKDKELENGEN